MDARDDVTVGIDQCEANAIFNGGSALRELTGTEEPGWNDDAAAAIAVSPQLSLRISIGHELPMGGTYATRDEHCSN